MVNETCVASVTAALTLDARCKRALTIESMASSSGVYTQRLQWRKMDRNFT